MHSQTTTTHPFQSGLVSPLPSLILINSLQFILIHYSAHGREEEGNTCMSFYIHLRINRLPLNFRAKEMPMALNRELKKHHNYTRPKPPPFSTILGALSAFSCVLGCFLEPLGLLTQAWQRPASFCTTYHTQHSCGPAPQPLRTATELSLQGTVVSSWPVAQVKWCSGLQNFLQSFLQQKKDALESGEC